MRTSQNEWFSTRIWLWKLLCKQSIKTKHMCFTLYIAMHTTRFRFEIAFWCMLIDDWQGCLFQFRYCDNKTWLSLFAKRVTSRRVNIFIRLLESWELHLFWMCRCCALPEVIMSKIHFITQILFSMIYFKNHNRNVRLIFI